MKDRSTFLLLAIEARRSRFGYALFDGPKRLLDWGASMVPSHLSDQCALDAARKRAATVLQRGVPAALVINRPRRTKAGLTATVGPVLRSILSEARASEIPVHFLGREEIRTAFGAFRVHSREEIAWMLTSSFPELLSRLPQKRKKWQPEKRGMVVFDAVAIGFAYWLRSGGEGLSPE
jgi:hypothetical protein